MTKTVVKGDVDYALACIALAIRFSAACLPSAPEPSPRMFSIMLQHKTIKLNWETTDRDDSTARHVCTKFS